ncbi:MAG: hypothetical protein WCO56_24150, partial [Verrucomicrobiota bacterium]
APTFTSSAPTFTSSAPTFTSSAPTFRSSGIALADSAVTSYWTMAIDDFFGVFGGLSKALTGSG